MKIKILRIIARLNIGGPAQNAILLTEGLTRLNFATVLLYGEIDNFEADMIYLARQKGVSPIKIEGLGRKISWKNDLRAFWKIFKLIYKEKPDIIHTHTAKAGTLGRLAGMFYNFQNMLNRRHIILVHTFHGHVLHSYFGRLKTLFFIWTERMLALFTHKIITVSGSLKKELVEKFRVASADKFSVIELGLELDRLLKLPIREDEGINIGIVGRLAPIKNHQMLLRVMEKLKTESLTAKIKLVVIGDGELRKELENYAQELKIQDKVEFIGWIKDLVNIYETLDIVVLTSLNEGTPVSLIEAMAAARPVIATDVGGVSDIVQDGKNGYLVESNSDIAFAEKIKELAGDFEKRKRIGEYGRISVKERFTKERLIKDMQILYNRLIYKE